ncbi:MAG TPA: NAD(P)-binding domain-containing protein [Humisphaera sp.]
MIAGQTDVAIVGAGPIGIELAVSLKRAGVDYLHFDAKQVGQTISWFAPGTRFFSSNERIAIAGVPLVTANQEKASREEYLAYLRSVVTQFDLRVNCYEPIVGIDREADGFTLTTRPAAGERRYRAKRVVLATGGTDRPRKLNVPGENLPHVSHYFQDPHTYFRQNLLVVGGKNSAVEAALRCHHAGARVSLSYRRPALPAKSIKYWLMPEISGLIEAKRIGGYFDTVPVRITPSHVTLQQVDDCLRPRGDSFEVPADFVLLLIGYEQDQTLLKLAGVDLSGDEGAPTFDPLTMETNVTGLYVAGTATGGTQVRYTVFIENCHVHVERIVAAIRGAAKAVAAPTYAAPES